MRRPQALVAAGAVAFGAGLSALAEGGRATYEEHASEAVLGARWRSLLERTVAAR